MKIRPVELTDKDQMRALGKAHAAETTPDEVWDEATAEATFTRATTTGNPAFYVAEINGKIVGYIGGRVVEKPFTSGFFTELDVIYVHPRYRGSRVAALLFDTYDRWASFVSNSEQYAVYTDNLPEAVLKMLVKRGYEPCGVILKKN